MIIKLEMALLAILLAYFIGSIPFGLILVKLNGGEDIRKIGSGNIGATNVLRTGNKKLAAITLLLDALKGLLAMTMANALIAHYSDPFLNDLVLLYAFVVVILGHIFPLWLRFKGGKGVATAIGALFFISPIAATGLIWVWLITFYTFRISSLAALSAFTLTTLATVIITASDPTVSSVPLKCVFAATMLLFYTHRQNISRLMRGEEHKWSKK